MSWKHKRQENGPSNVAFVETGGAENGFPRYACRKKHPGGYSTCRNVSETVWQQTIKAVKAGHFKKKEDNDSTISTKATSSTSRRSAPKKGAAFAEVKEEDEKEEDEEEALTLPTYKEYLRENGVISLNVGKTNLVF